MAHFQRHKVQALEVMRVKSSKSTAELLAGREVLRAGSTSLRASFTVSLLGDYQCCAWVFVCVFVVGAVFVVPQTGLPVGFYLRKKVTGHAGGCGGPGWARIWLCWAC